MTSPFALVAPAARQDLDDYTLWLRSEVDLETALRFAKAAILSFEKLAHTTGVGPRVPSRNRNLVGVRKWHIQGFPKILIFYRPSTNGVTILRVLHVAQDWWSLLDIDQSQH